VSRPSPPPPVEMDQGHPSGEQQVSDEATGREEGDRKKDGRQVVHPLHA
jgi:hypothetical protein